MCPAPPCLRTGGTAYLGVCMRVYELCVKYPACSTSCSLRSTEGKDRHEQTTHTGDLLVASSWVIPDKPSPLVVNDNNKHTAKPLSLGTHCTVVLRGATLFAHRIIASHS